jgi:hypothetical protein
LIQATQVIVKVKDTGTTIDSKYCHNYFPSLLQNLLEILDWDYLLLNV